MLGWLGCGYVNSHPARLLSVCHPVLHLGFRGVSHVFWPAFNLFHKLRECLVAVELQFGVVYDAAYVYEMLGGDEVLPALGFESGTVHTLVRPCHYCSQAYDFL